MARRMFVPLVIAGILGYCASIGATPSTQIWIPSTDIQKFADPHFGWDIYLTNTGNDNGGQTGSVSNGGITIGVLPFSKIGMEVGIDYRDLGGNHVYPVYFNAKLGTPEDAFFKYMPALAVGGYDFGTKKDINDNNIIYGLAAKTIGKFGRLSVGYYAGNKKLLLDMSDNAKADNSGLLLSWDRTISEISDKLWLALDYQGSKSSYGALSFGFSYNFAANASAILGYDIFNDNTTYKPTFTVQIDINLF
ncbi:MAG: hypothetical protein PHC61_00040 [Chitinivibrionales bacterium]|nr:hypothetical protein [Chitinivibrionales bacterium]